MLQREVIERMVAPPGSGEYGRLSIMLQVRYDMQKLFDVPPDAFDPPPKVMSSVVRMLPLPADRRRPRSEQAFAALVTKAFAQRRKMLRRVLADWAADIDWAALGVEPTDRPEVVSPEQFMAMSDQLVEAGKLK